MGVQLCSRYSRFLFFVSFLALLFSGVLVYEVGCV